MTQALSAALYREVRTDFFRILCGPLAHLYVDVVDALEREAAHRNYALDRDEALALIERTIESHSEISCDEDAFSQAGTARDKARAVLETLRYAGWLQEEQGSDWQRTVFLDSNGIVLFQALRRVAFPDAALFSDKLVSVCAALANPDTLAEQPWAQVESCIASLQAGLAELRGMQKSIERHTRQQLAAATLKENLELLFDRFAEQIGRNCYAQLVHARLPSRLAEARRAVEEELGRADLQARMQIEVMRREPNLAPEAAMARVRLRLHELTELLEYVEPLADAIDRRTAEFARRSQARFRYLQETASENRGRVQSFFETLNRRFAGRRLAEIAVLDLHIPPLLIHDARLFAGLDSLYAPRLHRIAEEIDPIEDADAYQQGRALTEIQGSLRNSLTISRANRFVDSLPGSHGTRLDSKRILMEHVHDADGLADLIACLLHARSADARFRIEVPRRETGANVGHFDVKLGYRVERFTLVKK